MGREGCRYESTALRRRKAGKGGKGGLPDAVTARVKLGCPFTPPSPPFSGPFREPVEFFAKLPRSATSTPAIMDLMGDAQTVDRRVFWVPLGVSLHPAPLRFGQPEIDWNERESSNSWMVLEVSLMVSGYGFPLKHFIIWHIMPKVLINS